MIMCFLKLKNGKATLYNDSLKESLEVLVNWLSSEVSAVYGRTDNKKLCDFKQAVDKIIVFHPLSFSNDTMLSFAEQQSLKYYIDNRTLSCPPFSKKSNY